ncbi:permease [Maribrevibacterium harenarium]|uniref:Permease n=1 Tax=Maribrevibacterium harenarium TaxID=2589817 RepID=A0A501WUC2_9GAMM|nr:SO_0444 family Cu/Zn efflux transporter [Maribrevibacterium harenarium]TPE53333.1 permease [Maribrevibacterium harenarium]
MSWLLAFVDLFLESAPWLLLGLLVAGVLKEFVPMDWMERQLGQQSRFAVVKAAIIGAPLPLCSCGVIPAAAGLRRAGASKGATTSFLISTPETGVDSIALSWVLLGPFMAIVRPIAAIVSAITAGYLVGRESPEPIAPELAPSSSCCSSGCCGSDKKAADAHPPLLGRIKSSLQYATTEMVDDIALWLLVGLAFAALVQAYVPQSFLAQWGDGLIAMLVMVIISIPMYICATASTPIAAGLLAAGVSPGAVLVFMLAGPATNIATLGMVNKLLGRRALWAYLTGVLACALGFGYLVDWLFSTFDGAIVLANLQSDDHPQSLVAILSSVVLILLMGLSIGKSLQGKHHHGAH